MIDRQVLHSIDPHLRTGKSTRVVTRLQVRSSPVGVGEDSSKAACVPISSNPFLDNFWFADNTGLGPDFVQMRPEAGYDFVINMPKALRVGGNR